MPRAGFIRLVTGRIRFEISKSQGVVPTQIVGRLDHSHRKRRFAPTC